MKIKSIALISSLALPAFLAACSIIPLPSPAAATSDVTPVYLTVQAHITQVLVTPDGQADNPRVLAVTAAPAAVEMDPAGAVIAAATPHPNARAEIPCDQVSPGQPIDVTVRDGTVFSPGEGFSKTWRLVNAGRCPWTRDYAVVWFSGEQMGVQGAQNLPAEIGPGQSFELTVDMIAPQTPGIYQSNWKLKNPDGELFGLGPNGNAPFWVQIEVVAVSTPTPEQEVSPAPTLPVFVSNITNLVYNDGLDLDTGEINLESENDVTYRVGVKGAPEIVPQNNARIALFGSQVPTESDCQVADLKNTALTLEKAGEGLYLCYRTNRALPGYMHIQQPTPEDALISVDFVTWTVP